MSKIKKMGLGTKLKTWLSPDPPLFESPTIKEAQRFINKNPLGSILYHKDYIDNYNMMIIDDGIETCFGWTIKINPVFNIPYETEQVLNSFIEHLPIGSIVQFGVLSSSKVEEKVQQWEKQHGIIHNDLIRNIVHNSGIELKAAAKKHSLLATTDKDAELHTRDIQYYITVKIRFNGKFEDDKYVSKFLKWMNTSRKKLMSDLQELGITSIIQNQVEIRKLLLEILYQNYHLPERFYDPKYIVKNGIDEYFNEIEEEVAIDIKDNGIIFYNNNETEQVVTLLTVDSYPSEIYTESTNMLLGNPAARLEKINCPFWAYNMVEIIGGEKSKGNVLASLNQPEMKTSPWHFNMKKQFINEDEEVVQIKENSSKYKIVKCYSGINLYCEEKEAGKQADKVKDLWRKYGYRAGSERFVPYPAFLYSVPMQYSANLDKDGLGLQRSVLINSFHAANLFFGQGDYIPGEGYGLPLVSRKGHINFLDLNSHFMVIGNPAGGANYLVKALIIEEIAQGNQVLLVSGFEQDYSLFNQLVQDQKYEYVFEKNNMEKTIEEFIKKNKGKYVTIFIDDQDNEKLIEKIKELSKSDLCKLGVIIRDTHYFGKLTQIHENFPIKVMMPSMYNSAERQREEWSLLADCGIIPDSPSQKSIVNSIRTGSGFWELYIVYHDKKMISRWIPDKYLLFLIENNPQLQKRIQANLDEGMSSAEALFKEVSNYFNIPYKKEK